MTEIVAEKTCRKCGEVKPLDKFVAHRKCVDGRTHTCKACSNAEQRARKRANREAANAYQREWYAKNAEKSRARTQAWRDRQDPERYREVVSEWGRKRYANMSPEKRARRRRLQREWERKRAQELNQRKREWRRANAERHRAQARQWELRRRAALASADQREILNRDLERLYSSPCAACGSTDDIHADHVIPLARGGRHSIGNLQPLCAPCNLSKGAKLVIEWRAA